jgi:hypothetical protein
MPVTKAKANMAEEEVSVHSASRSINCRHRPLSDWYCSGALIIWRNADRMGA